MPRRDPNKPERSLGVLWHIPDGADFDRAQQTWYEVWLNPEAVSFNGRRYHRINETTLVPSWDKSYLYPAFVKEGRERCFVTVKYAVGLPWGRKKKSQTKSLRQFVDEHAWYCEDGRFLTAVAFRAETGMDPFPENQKSVDGASE